MSTSSFLGLCLPVSLYLDILSGFSNFLPLWQRHVLCRSSIIHTVETDICRLFECLFPVRSLSRFSCQFPTISRRMSLDYWDELADNLNDTYLEVGSSWLAKNHEDSVFWGWTPVWTTGQSYWTGSHHHVPTDDFHRNPSQCLCPGPYETILEVTVTNHSGYKFWFRSDNERYRNGTGVALCSMAAADLCSLLLICSQNLQQLIITEESSDMLLMHASCKVPWRHSLLIPPVPSSFTFWLTEII